MSLGRALKGGREGGRERERERERERHTERERKREREGDQLVDVTAVVLVTPSPLVSEAGLLRASKALSAASMPVFMALWVPLILGTLRKPGLQPTRQPPGKASLGMH